MTDRVDRGLEGDVRTLPRQNSRSRDSASIAEQGATAAPDPAFPSPCLRQILVSWSSFWKGGSRDRFQSASAKEFGTAQGRGFFSLAADLDTRSASMRTEIVHHVGAGQDRHPKAPMDAGKKRSMCLLFS